MSIRVGLFSSLMVPALVVAGTGPAAAQTATSRTTPVAASTTQCPAVHMLLAPGTSETARFAEPNQDTHGFLSRDLARPVMNAVNGPNIGDLSSGFAELLDLPDGMQSLASTAGKALGAAMTSHQQQVPRVSRTYVTYPATVGGAQPPGMQGIPLNVGDLTPYGESMLTGVEMTEDLMGKIATKCPDTKVFLAGFSQGAEVISNVARRAGAGLSVIDPSQIGGVALFADPTRAGGTPLHPEGSSTVGPVPGTDGENVQRALVGLDQLATANAGGLGTDKTGLSDFGQIADRVVSWCLPGDYVCGLPAESELVTDIVPLLEEVSLGDPVAALERLARILDRAVSIGDLSEVVDLGFSGVGFSPRPDGGAKTPVLSKRVQAATAEATTAASTSSQTTSTSTTSSTSETSETAEPSPVQAPAGQVLPPAPPMPAGPGLPGIPPLPTPEQVVRTVVDVAAGLGGMALGAGITVVRKTVTPENLAQIAVAGLTGGPPAAGAVAVAKLSESAMSLLEPGSASGLARQTLQVFKDAGVPVPEQVELAVSLTAWLSTNEHNAYADRPVLPDGRSPAAATVDWVQAIAQDVTAGSDEPLAPAPRRSVDGLSALATVEFDNQAARAALDDLGYTTTTSSTAVSTATSAPSTSASPTSSYLEGN